MDTARLTMMPRLSVPQYRRRQSLNDGGLRARGKTKARALERHSTVGGGGLELSLLQHLHVEFVKAVVPGNKLSQPRYIMRITNQALQQSWEMGRTFTEFHDLKESIVQVLDHGHFCTSNCPWLYMFVAHQFPRRHLFRSRSSSVITTRLTELDTFLNSVLHLFKDNRNLDCAVSSERLPRILYDFLYEGMVFDRADFNNTILEDRVSLVGNQPEGATSFSSNEESCSICAKPLVKPCTRAKLEHSESTSSLDTTSTASSTDSGSNIASQSYAESFCSSLTTLDCGHRFHDECILAKLNEVLECPLCSQEKQQPMPTSP